MKVDTSCSAEFPTIPRTTAGTYDEGMPSPFRNTKQERRRWRKAARTIVHPTVLEKWENMPEAVETLKRIAGQYTGIAQAEREKTPKPLNLTR
jgi:hypothetical protein